VVLPGFAHGLESEGHMFTHILYWEPVNTTWNGEEWLPGIWQQM
jgi:hypothetical protein